MKTGIRVVTLLRNSFQISLDKYQLSVLFLSSTRSGQGEIDCVSADVGPLIQFITVVIPINSDCGVKGRCSGETCVITETV